MFKLWEIWKILKASHKPECDVPERLLLIVELLKEVAGLNVTMLFSKEFIEHFVEIGRYSLPDG